MFMINTEVSVLDIEHRDYLGIEAAICKALPILKTQGSDHANNISNGFKVQSTSDATDGLLRDRFHHMADFFVEAFVK